MRFGPGRRPGWLIFWMLLAAIVVAGLVAGKVLLVNGGTQTPRTVAELVDQANKDPAMVSQLEPEKLEFSYGPKPQSLKEAVTKGDTIVRGVVTARTFEVGPEGMVYTYVTVAVSDRIKGDDRPTITVRQIGGPTLMPVHESDKPEPVFADTAADPVLSIGDEAVLILVAAPYIGPDVFVSAWPATSQYRVQNGVANPTSENPLAELRDLSVADLIGRLKDAARP